ncbi:hypothetical protein BJX62DRAFT_222675 [Aspergillus germanicus]
MSISKYMILNTILDSLNHALKHIPKNLLPQTFIKGTMEGVYISLHSADFLHGACLYLYGGVFMDDLGIPYIISTLVMCDIYMVNRFIVARKGDAFVKHWHELFVYNLLFTFIINKKFNELQEQVFKYITQLIMWKRIVILEDNAREGRLNRVGYGIEEKIRFKGEDIFNLLKTRKAYKIMWRCLTQCSMEKEKEGVDIKKGIFAKLLRYRATRFQQIREEIAVVQIKRPKVMMKKGIYEP